MTTYGFSTTGDEIVRDFEDQVRGKTFLITGPSEKGIGAETAISLAKASPKLLVLAGRSKSKIDPVIEIIRQSLPSTKLEFIELDLSSKESVRNAVEEIKALEIKLDVLLNNAAVMACPYGKTANGIEMQFGTNHIGPFLFTTLLLKAKIINPNATIVNVNSTASIRKGSLVLPYFDNLTYSEGKDYNPWIAYSVSKSANLLWTRSLAEKVKSQNITTFSLNPGSIASPLQRYITPDMIEDAMRISKEYTYDWQNPPRKSLQEGCSTQLRAALDPSLAAQSGGFLHDCQPLERPEHVEQYVASDKVWKLSEEMAGEKFGV